MADAVSNYIKQLMENAQAYKLYELSQQELAREMLTNPFDLPEEEK